MTLCRLYIAAIYFRFHFTSPILVFFIYFNCSAKYGQKTKPNFFSIRRSGSIKNAPKSYVKLKKIIFFLVSSLFYTCREANISSCADSNVCELDENENYAVFSNSSVFSNFFRRRCLLSAYEPHSVLTVVVVVFLLPVYCSVVWRIQFEKYFKRYRYLTMMIKMNLKASVYTTTTHTNHRSTSILTQNIKKLIYQFCIYIPLTHKFGIKSNEEHGTQQTQKQSFSNQNRQ